jgi:protein transport protein SEC61 subunit gamma-like protein
MLREFFHECKRVWRVARKPDKSEYLTIAKVTGLGILLVGFVGFIIMIVAHLLGLSVG